ncbi:Fanconi anemia group D2 homolog, putative [Babesia ovis]|uniref:Fanconi anemia group D2 homolog, putative n=1 Tax=Babesia ovis TaxID=5869 RepID=A0A9W5WV79_BABOV|nr:Fanconi anemia group D2 homolog, putative [Babesia ovis]
MYPPKGKGNTASTGSRFAKTFLKFTNSSSVSSGSTASSWKHGSSKGETKGGATGSVTAVPAGDHEECAAVEPSSVCEVSDELPTAAMERGYEMNINKFKSLVINGSPRNNVTLSGGDSHSVQESGQKSSGNFIDTLRTLVEITSLANNEEVRSLSNCTSGTDDDEDFSLVAPIRDATYNILDTSSKFIKNVSGDSVIMNSVNSMGFNNASQSEVVERSGTDVPVVTTSITDPDFDVRGTWNFIDVSKWL